MKGVKLQENPEVKGNELISLEKKVIIIISCTSFDDYHDERENSLCFPAHPISSSSPTELQSRKRITRMRTFLASLVLMPR